MSSALWTMTSTLSTALSSKSTNPSNFSGAVDIIIVKHADATCKSTPFHLRFGKYLAENPFNLKVSITINDHPLNDLCMTLNKNGIAHFDGAQQETQAPKQDTKEEEKSITVSTTDDGSGTNADAAKKADSAETKARKRDKLKAFAQSSWSYFSGSEDNDENDANKGKKRDINKYIKDTLKSQWSEKEDISVNNIPTNDMIKVLSSKLKYGKNKVMFTIETASKMDRIKKKLYKKKKVDTNTKADDNDSDNDVMDGMLNETADGSDIKMKDRTVCANIYLWDATDRIIICDVDGTITKSDVGGHIFPHIGFDYVQTGICKLLNRINASGYRIIYLTARGIGHAMRTRSYLFDEIDVPNGAVICSPSTTRAALYREVIEKRPQDFKVPTLQCITDAFGDNNPFIAGFGNKDTDAMTYSHFNISSSMIFIIGLMHKKQKKEEKKEDKEETEQVSATYIKDYNEIFERVNNLFPQLENVNR